MPRVVEKDTSRGFSPRHLSHADLPPHCMRTNRYQRARAVSLQTDKTSSLNPRGHAFTDIREYTAADKSKRFAEVRILIRLWCMIKNNCSAAVWMRRCEVTRYCPTALFCRSGTGPQRQSLNGRQLKHTYAHARNPSTYTSGQSRWDVFAHLCSSRKDL